MKNNFTAFLLGILLLVLQVPAWAQTTNVCATGRIKSASRMALATPAQQKLMNKYDVNFYKLDIALERTSTAVSGNVLIQAKTKTAALDTFAFELYQTLAIDSVIVNGVKRTISRQTGMTYVRLIPAIPANTAISTKIYYKGTPPAPGSAAIGEGMTSASSPSWGNQVTWSLSEPFSAYEWFPCKQMLTDKADSSEVWVTTSATNKVGSNGLLKQTTTLPNGKLRYEWKSRYPIDYYLISVSVAQYVDYTIFANPVGAPNPVPVVNYIYNNPGTLPAVQNEVNNTPQLIVKFSELFGLYPFHKEKYGHCMAPLSGGMEHQTMTTLGFFNFTLIAHELAHQWFGDHVTCASWRDIWLNEGFASYAEYLALEKLRAGQQGAWMDNAHTDILSATGGSVYLPAIDSANVNRIFDSRLTYNKGAAVLHMLRFEMNNDVNFFNTLKQYQNQYAFSTAKTPQFKAVAEAVSGKNLTQFFNQWVYGQGYPTFNIAWNQTGKDLLIRATQTASQSGVTPFFETDVQYRIVTSLVDTLISVRQTQAVQFFTVRVRGNVSIIQVDPNQWILNKVGTIVKNTSLVMGVENELASIKFTVYPNPASDKLLISDLKFKPETYEVQDMTGRIILMKKATELENALPIETLATGMYVLRVSGQNKSASASFQKR